MGWVQDQFAKRAGTQEGSTSDNTSQANERDLWSRLLRGLGQDVEEFQRLGGDCGLQQLEELQCRISNQFASVSAVITADLAASTIEYGYESNEGKTAVPEKGILTLRHSGGVVDLFSADQRLTPEQARQLILEPLMFPTLPTDVAAERTQAVQVMSRSRNS